MTIPAILFQDQSLDERGAERFRVRFGASWLDGGQKGPELTIIDVSTTGFLLESSQSLPVDSSIIVELPDNVSKVCRIVWNCGKFHGAVFAEQLSTLELERILAASPIVWPNFREEDRPVPSGRLAKPEGHEPDVSDFGKEEMLPLVTRGRIIIGTASLLWAIIGGVVWLAFR